MLPDGIRNYMSKPWFLSMTMEAAPTPLAAQIASILKPTSSHLCTKDGAKIAEQIGNGMAKHM
jgi:cystathionine beta-synthase